MRNIVSALRDIDLPDINCGGCGIAALAAIRLAKKHNEDVKVIFLYTEEREMWFESNQSLIKDGLIKFVSIPSHIAIEFDGVVVDTGGNVSMSMYSCYHYDVTETELVLLLNHGDWNLDFERDKAIPRIEKILDIKLDDVKLEVIS